MTGIAVGLVLFSAFIHATWNLLAKRVEGGTAFLWLVYLTSATVYSPLALAVIVVAHPVVGAAGIGFMAGTVFLHTAFFALLAAGYRAGDLSLVYPIARSTGPFVATIGAIVLYAERPTPLALAGGLAIVVGAVFLTGDPRRIRAAGSGRAVGFALLTGLTIATYTLWDKHAVSALAIPPLLYDWSRNLGQTLLVAPLALRQRERLGLHWRVHRREVIGVAVLSPLAYILVLTALSVSPVSYVAPLRESGILIGALMGTRILAEEGGRRRVVAAATMAAGIVALAVG
ncbi:MAG: EamA family transporter [Chloroflexota bacterium]|nr:EamA family transporter [Chloroflexota bacterium]MDE3101845.1 EamA family transporter [Chloroflexota bacterium]